MEIRTFAETVLLTETLEEKLKRHKGSFTDDEPGDVLRVEEPGRPGNLQFAAPRTAPGMPHHKAFLDPLKLAVAHHIMANHELQAVEVMCFVLCRFPDAPKEFRVGLVNIIDDEQRHTRMHADRAAELGIPFGELPVNCYIWKKALSFENVMDYLAGLPLTFEGRNLDHSLEFEEHFLGVKDEKSAAIMRVIHKDEIEHVRFGLEWLRNLKDPGQSDWEAYESHLHWPLRPKNSKGDNFQREPRRKAGMSEEFIDRLADVDLEEEDGTRT